MGHGCFSETYCDSLWIDSIFCIEEFPNLLDSGLRILLLILVTHFEAATACFRPSRLLYYSLERGNFYCSVFSRARSLKSYFSSDLHFRTENNARRCRKMLKETTITKSIEQLQVNFGAELKTIISIKKIQSWPPILQATCAQSVFRCGCRAWWTAWTWCSLWWSFGLHISRSFSFFFNRPNIRLCFIIVLNSWENESDWSGGRTERKISEQIKNTFRIIVRL